MNTIESTLRERIPTIKRILDITRQPGLSLGVIHHGQEVLKANFGVRDVRTGEEPNSDTLYCVASLTKAFMAASIDQLVQEKKLSWDTTIQSIIPEFQHAAKPGIYSDMTVRDICSHRTGLLSLDEITQGMDGRILMAKKDLVKIINALPIKHDLRTRFLYNNALYALAGDIVERLSEQGNWGDYQHARIFEPLGMARTTAFRSVHETDSNVATGYMILTDGARSPIPPTELDANSMNGGSGGVRSSVNDLLKWSQSLLRSFRSGDDDSEKVQVVRKGSPMFDRAAIANPQSAEDGDYCMGWCHHRTPAKLGLISPNRTLESPVLGEKSPSLLIYGHQGDVPGYTCNIYVIPESESAIVILSNGTGLSDATDWIAQDLIQTMHGLQPAIDFVEVATRAAKQYRLHYDNDFKLPLERHRRPGTQRPPLDRLVGSYMMDALEDVVVLDVAMDEKDSSKLRMTINKQTDQTYQLSHYEFDVFSQLPGSADECLRRGLDRTLWSAFLISFERDEASKGKATGLTWKLDGVDVHFSRSAKAVRAPTSSSQLPKPPLGHLLLRWICSKFSWILP